MKRIVSLAAMLAFGWMVVAGQGNRIAQSSAGQKPDTDSAVRAKARKTNTPVVTARFIPDSIAIGDQFVLRLEVTKDIVQQVSFPMGYQQEGSPVHYIAPELEIIGVKPIDTVKVDGRRVTLRQDYLLTTFQAGWNYFKSFPVLYVDKNITDTLYAKPDSLLLQIGTFQIDTTTQTIYDIKTPLRVPLKFGEFSGYLLLELLFVLLVVGGILLWRKWKRDHRIFGRREQIPPHVAAIRALEALHHQKLWQNNKHKQYYTLLTDIVRTYIEGRYGIQAMEMTTDELMRALKEQSIDEKNRTQLAALLGTADLAKFAKFTPPAEDNETCYNDAFYFVENTKPTEVETGPETPRI